LTFFHNKFNKNKKSKISLIILTQRKDGLRMIITCLKTATPTAIMTVLRSRNTCPLRSFYSALDIDVTVGMNLINLLVIKLYQALLKTKSNVIKNVLSLALTDLKLKKKYLTVFIIFVVVYSPKRNNLVMIT
jgi:hypothetical protein